MQQKQIPTSRRIRNREAFLAKQALEGNRREREFADVMERQTRKLSGEADVRQAAEVRNDAQVIDRQPKGQNKRNAKTQAVPRRGYRKAQG